MAVLGISLLNESGFLCILAVGIFFSERSLFEGNSISLNLGVMADMGDGEGRRVRRERGASLKSPWGSGDRPRQPSAEGFQWLPCWEL